MGRSGEIWPLGDWVPPDPGSTFRINRQEEDRSEVRRKEGGKEGRREGNAAEPISSVANFWDEKDFSAFRETPPQQSKSGKGTRERERKGF